MFVPVNFFAVFNQNYVTAKMSQSRKDTAEWVCVVWGSFSFFFFNLVFVCLPFLISVK